MVPIAVLISLWLKIDVLLRDNAPICSMMCIIKTHIIKLIISQAFSKFCLNNCYCYKVETDHEHTIIDFDIKHLTITS